MVLFVVIPMTIGIYYIKMPKQVRHDNNVFINTENIYQPIYTEMRERNTKAMLDGNVKPDVILNNQEDPRRGIGLFAFGKFVLNKQFTQVLREAGSLFSNQVVYSLDPEVASTQALLHCTIFQFFGVESIDPRFQPEVLKQYDEVLSDVLSQVPPFTVTYAGIIAVPSGLLMYGYPSININSMRDEIRAKLDERHILYKEPYKSDIVHSTLMRLRNPVAPTELLNFAKKYGDTDLGTLRVTDVALCYASWRMRPNEVKNVHEYQLQSR